MPLSTEHFLLGILREPDCYGAKLLMEKGIDQHIVREEIVGHSDA